MCGNTWRDIVRNKNIHAKLGVALSVRRCKKIVYNDLVKYNVDIQIH